MAKIYWSRGGRGVRCSFDKCEHPIVCQLGGGDPDRVGEAAKMVAEKGYHGRHIRRRRHRQRQQ